MRSAISPSRAFALSVGAAAALGIALMLAGAGIATAQSMPDSENGRYTMVPVPDGVLRLDTRKGTVSTCSDSKTGWACYAVPDERSALDAEIGRLQAQVENLKAQLASREPPQPGGAQDAQPKSETPGKGEPKAAEGGRRIEIPLPSDEDVDRVMSFLERAWRRLIDMANRMQKEAAGTI